ncbi:hypothetical protein HY214_02110 [Candidatus Roizmanbacteria bacterium]|nr:hypothetical protein [Candidatus Roizmanbacteria bacterium]
MDYQKSTQELKVNEGTYIGSIYSQVVSITVTDVDLTIEFVYVNPRSKTGQLVSRVTLPRKSGEDLAKAIFTTVKMHETKKKGDKND